MWREPEFFEKFNFPFLDPIRECKRQFSIFLYPETFFFQISLYSFQLTLFRASLSFTKNKITLLQCKHVFLKKIASLDQNRYFKPSFFFCFSEIFFSNMIFSDFNKSFSCFFWLYPQKTDVQRSKDAFFLMNDFFYFPTQLEISNGCFSLILYLNTFFKLRI